jgi:hypothetical protein
LPRHWADIDVGHLVIAPEDDRKEDGWWQAIVGARSLLQELLLPGVNLVGMRCAKSDTVACSRSASRAILAFSSASIFRLVLFVIIRSV